MKTNVSIKFNSIEEYREIEKKLIELGYESDNKWNEKHLNVTSIVIVYNRMFSVSAMKSYKKTYNSLQEFLKD